MGEISDVFLCIFLKDNFCSLINISLKFVPKGPIDSKSSLVQVMAWCRMGGKPLPEVTVTQFTEASLDLIELTHWGRDEIDTILQTTFSNAFSWMKMFEFRLKFHWNLFPSVQLTITHHWFR